VRNTVALPSRPRAWLARQPPLAAVDACIDRLDPVRSAALRACGVELWTWTCTRPRHLALARRAGCTRAICDDPAWAQARA
jgi:hypothetical protein